MCIRDRRCIDLEVARSSEQQRLRSGGVVVIPLASIEALANVRPLLEKAGLAVRVQQLQAWRGQPLGDGTRLAPMNPTLIVTGAKPA